MSSRCGVLPQRRGFDTEKVCPGQYPRLQRDGELITGLCGPVLVVRLQQHPQTPDRGPIIRIVARAVVCLL